jgi:hypothetical protein
MESHPPGFKPESASVFTREIRKDFRSQSPAGQKSTKLATKITKKVPKETSAAIV